MITVHLLDQPAFPVRTIFCIGRNYAAHVRELEHALPASPVVFLKPVTTLVPNGGTIRLPAESDDVQHEVELVVLIGRPGRLVQPDRALDLVAGYGVGIDVTARDLQRRAQSLGEPWTIAKGCDTFAPVSDFVPAERVPNPQNLALELRVNGEIRQRGNTRDMLFGIAEIIAHLSRYFSLQHGDLIFTGTPEGVGPIRPGDTLLARLSDCGLELRVDAARAQAPAPDGAQAW